METVVSINEEHQGSTDASDAVTAQKPKIQASYAPTMEGDDLVEWRKELRRQRNRKSEAARRKKTSEKIAQLEGDLQNHKSFYEHIQAHIRNITSITMNYKIQDPLSVSMQAPSPKKRKTIAPTTNTPSKKKSPLYNQPQNRYEPPNMAGMTKAEIMAWRKEERRVRNRESAAASRKKTAARIVELEGQVQEYKRACEAMHVKMLHMQSHIYHLTQQQHGMPPMSPSHQELVNFSTSPQVPTLIGKHIVTPISSDGASAAKVMPRSVSQSFMTEAVKSTQQFESQTENHDMKLDSQMLPSKQDGGQQKTQPSTCDCLLTKVLDEVLEEDKACASVPFPASNHGQHTKYEDEAACEAPSSSSILDGINNDEFTKYLAKMLDDEH